MDPLSPPSADVICECSTWGKDHHAARLHTFRPSDGCHRGIRGRMRGQERRQLLPEQLRLCRVLQGGREVREALQEQLRALPLLRVCRRFRRLGRHQGGGIHR